MATLPIAAHALVASFAMLASGRSLAGGLLGIFVGLGIVGLLALVCLVWTIKLLSVRRALDATERRLLFRLGGVQLIAALASLGTWVGLGATFEGDESMLLGAALGFGVMGLLALRRAGRAGGRRLR